MEAVIRLRRNARVLLAISFVTALNTCKKILILLCEPFFEL